MDEMEPVLDVASPVTLEINANHRYKAEEMGVIEFRIKNQSSRTIKALDLTLDCPYEKSQTKSATVKSLLPSAEKKPVFLFEPEKAGEGVLKVVVKLQDENLLPLVFRGHAFMTIFPKNDRNSSGTSITKNDGKSSGTSLTINIPHIEKFTGNDLGDLLGGTGKNQGLNEESLNDGKSSGTSLTIDIHDIEKFMGNDLGDLLGGAGKNQGLNEERLNDWMRRKDPLWMRVDLEVDEVETLRLREDARNSGRQGRGCG